MAACAERRSANVAACDVRLQRPRPSGWPPFGQHGAAAADCTKSASMSTAPAVARARCQVATRALAAAVGGLARSLSRITAISPSRVMAPVSRSTV